MKSRSVGAWLCTMTKNPIARAARHNEIPRSHTNYVYSYTTCNNHRFLHKTLDHTQTVPVLVRNFWFVHFPHKQGRFINKSDSGSDVVFTRGFCTEFCTSKCSSREKRSKSNEDTKFDFVTVLYQNKNIKTDVMQFQIPRQVLTSWVQICKNPKTPLYMLSS